LTKGLQPSETWMPTLRIAIARMALQNAKARNCVRAQFRNAGFRSVFRMLKIKQAPKRLFYLQFLGWLMGLEPTTTGITILDSTN
jgi:hypothetical protein